MPDSSNPSLLLLVGRNPVREALKYRADQIEKVLLLQGRSRGLDGIRRAASTAGVPVQFVPSRRLDHLAPGLNHQGVVALRAPVAYRDVDEMLVEVAATWDEVRQEMPIVLVLDRVVDPHNFGAILRTALAAGVGGVIVPQANRAPLNSTVLKASAGMATQLPIARVKDLPGVLDQLKERGYWVIGASGEGATSVWELDWERPVALVMGSEEAGLHPAVAKTCDDLVAIPLRGHVESLNVSVAAGILLFTAARVRISL